MRHDALVFVVNEVAARAVRAEADGVVRSAPLRLVLGVTGEVPQLVRPVRELTLITVLAMSALLEGPAQLRLVASRVHTAAVAVNPIFAVAQTAVQLAVRGVPPWAVAAVVVPAGTVLTPRHAGRRGGQGPVVQSGARTRGGRARQVAMSGLGVCHRRHRGVREALATVVSGLLHAASATAVAVAAVLETKVPKLVRFSLLRLKYRK